MSESFLQVVTQSLLFTGFDWPRSKIYEGESFLGLSQSFLFRAFCIKRSGTGEVAESFFWVYIYQAEFALGPVKQCFQEAFVVFVIEFQVLIFPNFWIDCNSFLIISKVCINKQITMVFPSDTHLSLHLVKKWIVLLKGCLVIFSKCYKTEIFVGRFFMFY